MCSSVVVVTIQKTLEGFCNTISLHSLWILLCLAVLDPTHVARNVKRQEQNSQHPGLCLTLAAVNLTPSSNSGFSNYKSLLGPWDGSFEVVFGGRKISLIQCRPFTRG